MPAGDEGGSATGPGRRESPLALGAALPSMGKKDEAKAEFDKASGITQAANNALSGGLVPVVSVTVPLTPSHTWPLVQAIAGPVPAAAPVPNDIVPEPIMNFPDTKPVAVVFPLPVTVSTADGE